MTNPRGKGETLSATCKTFLKKWLIQEITGKRVEFKAKPTDKGNEVEDDAIIYAGCHIPQFRLGFKNEKRFENKYLKGTPDVLPPGWVFDLKSSYSAETFPLFETELPEDDYEWQVLGYMDLTKARKGGVIYALMSMPEHMIEKEARWKLGNFYTQAQYEAFARNYRYDELEPALRLKKYLVNYDRKKIQAIHARVIECRQYIKTELWPALEANRLIFPEFN